MQPQTGTVRDALVSIVVPVCNTEAYLIRCLDSILSQTHQNLELLLIDDGSTDGSGEILDRTAKTDARIRVVHQQNAGVSAARNRGIDMAKGEYLGFVDSDDWVEPDYLERLLRPFAEIEGLDVSACGWTVHRGEQAWPGTQCGYGRLDRDGAIKAALDHSRGFHGYLWNKLFRADLFRTDPAFRLDADLAICEDLLLCVKIFASGVTVYDGGEPLYHYLFRASGALRTFDKRRMSEFTARERIAELLKPEGSLYRAAELAQVKSALNLLAEAKETKNRALEKDLLRRIDARLSMLLRARDLPRKERAKLVVRRVFPKWSMRVFLRFHSNGGEHGSNI